jgi:hypothetical protein
MIPRYDYAKNIVFVSTNCEQFSLYFFICFWFSFSVFSFESSTIHFELASTQSLTKAYTHSLAAAPVRFADAPDPTAAALALASPSALLMDRRAAAASAPGGTGTGSGTGTGTSGAVHEAASSAAVCDAVIAIRQQVYRVRARILATGSGGGDKDDDGTKAGGAAKNGADAVSAAKDANAKPAGVPGTLTRQASFSSNASKARAKAASDAVALANPDGVEIDRTKGLFDRAETDAAAAAAHSIRYLQLSGRKKKRKHANMLESIHATIWVEFTLCLKKLSRLSLNQPLVF